MRRAIPAFLVLLIAACLQSPDPARIVVSSLRLEPADAFIGDSIQIHITIERLRPGNGATTLDVFADGVRLGRREVSHQGPPTENFTLLYVEDDPGDHALTALGEAATLRVLVPLIVWSDHSEVGLPTPKRDLSLEEFAYDATNFTLFQRRIHGTNVTIPIHNSLLAQSELGGRSLVPAQEFAEWVFEVFDLGWHTFGGYAYSNATFPLYGIGDSCHFGSATAVGFPTCYLDTAQSLGDANHPPHPLAVDAYRDLFVHELFHMWNGGTIQYMPHNTSGFATEQWFTEGATTYYSARLLATPVSLKDYERVLGDAWSQYRELLPTAGGLNFEQIAAQTPPPRSGPSPYVDMLYHRGALVSYLLDAELVRHGKNLDDLLRHLYATHGIEDRPFENADLHAAAETVAQTDLDPFFEAFVYGGAEVQEPPGFVDHVGNRIRPAPGLAD